MLRTVYLFLTLAAFWFLLSGHYTGLLIAFGVVSSLLVVMIAGRMDTVDESPVRLAINPVNFVKYWIWLAKEIFLSNIKVAKLVLSRDLIISPSIFRVKAENLSQIVRVAYANSITLTPGTVAIDVGDDWIEVHALTDETRNDLLAGNMGKRVRTISINAQ